MHPVVVVSVVDGGGSISTLLAPSTMAREYDPVPRHVVDHTDGDEEDDDDDNATDGIGQIPHVGVAHCPTSMSTTMMAVSRMVAVAHAVARPYQWRLREWFHRRIICFGGPHVVITYGQLVLLLPIFVCIVASTYLTVWHKNTGQTGRYAFYSIFYAFLLAQKKTGPFRLLMNTSWERLVPTHRLAAVAGLFLAVLHAYVAYTGHDYRPCREKNSMDMNEVAVVDETLPLCRDTPSVHQHQHQHVLSELRLVDNPRFRHSQIGLDPNVWQFLWDGPRNRSGTHMLLCLALLVMLSYNREWLRKPYYELWLVLHISSAGAFVAYAGKHRVGTWFVVVVIWWAIDGLCRYGLGTIWRWPKTATLSVLSADYNDDDNPVVHNNNNNDNSTKVVVVELSFPKTVPYQAGQYMRVAIMETGQPIMFHPFTISSAPYEQNVTVHFRPLSSGGWTQHVSQLVEHNDKGNFCSVLKRNEGPSSRANNNNSNNNRRTTVHVLLEGPYGGLSMNLWDDDPYRYPVVILIAGGIGVTPIRSITRQLLHEQQQHNDHQAGYPLRRMIRVVWAVRDVALVEALPLLDRYHRPDDIVPDDESGKALASTTTTTRPLSNDTVRDGLVRGKNDPAMTDDVHHHGNNSDAPKTAHFDASIYVTGPKNQDDGLERVSNGLEDRAPFRSRNGQRRKHRRNGNDGADEIELGKVIGRCHDDGQTPSQPPMIPKSSQSTSTCHKQHDDDRISFFTGRPDIHVILETTLSSTNFHSDQRVAVIVCGPPALMQDAKMVSSNLHGRPVPVDFHEEVFEW
jgi:predicted ferric reductase